MDDKNGFWQFDKIVDASDFHENKFNDHFTFYYHDDEVIIRLASISPTKWESADGIYRLKAKWVSNTLLYLSPMGSWVYLAMFENGKFIQRNEKQMKLFKRVLEDEIPIWNKSIAKIDRLKFEYDLVK